MNPTKAKDLKRLRMALTASRRTLEPFRANRMAALQQYVGKHYGCNGSDHEVPMNILALAVMIYARNMFARTPHVMVNTDYLALKWRATNFELAMNKLLPDIAFKRQMDLCIVNSMFSMGIMKVALAGAGSVPIDDMVYEYGRPYAKAVDLDDWVHDTCARSWDEISFCGNRYRIPLAKARELDIFDKAEREKLVKTEKNSYFEDADSERVEKLGKGDSYDVDEYEDYVELWDLWLPRDGVVVTLPVQGGDKPLATVEWTGPDRGPYHLLSFLDVPNNIMPVPPCAHWLDLHNLINSLWRKLAQQARREKQVTLVRPGGEEDGKRILEANDGEMIKSDDPKNVGEARYGGPDQQTMMFAMQAKLQASYLAGNLDTLGGLSPQSETLGGERLLAQNASRQMAEMQDRVVEFNRNVIRDLGEWLWTDQFIEMPLTRRIEGTELELHTTFGPEDRQGDFLDYNLDIDPYSLQDTSPPEKLKNLMELVNGMALPLLPLMQQQGQGLNIEQVFRLYAKYTNMGSDLDQILTFMAPPQPEPSQSGAPVTPPRSAPKPAVTKRIEERISRPGATQKGEEAIMGKMMAGMTGTQPKEAAVAGRAVG